MTAIRHESALGYHEQIQYLNYWNLRRIEIKGEEYYLKNIKNIFNNTMGEKHPNQK